MTNGPANVKKTKEVQGVWLTCCFSKPSPCYDYKRMGSFSRSKKSNNVLTLWQYWLWSFQTGYKKLETFLHKNQHTQRKLLNFENWTNGEPLQPSKIRICKIEYFILLLFLMPKLRSVAQNEWKKHPCIFFLPWVQK